MTLLQAIAIAQPFYFKLLSLYLPF